MAGSLKVMIIVENNRRRKSIKDFLSQYSFLIEEASEFPKAADQLLSANSFSIILVDFEDKDKQKLSTIQSIKKFNPELGIIVLSDQMDAKFAVSLYKKGIVSHVVKPDNKSGLFSAIKNELLRQDLVRDNKMYQEQIQDIRNQYEKNLRRALDLEEIYDSTLENLMTALDLRDVETFGHSRTVAKYSQVLAKIMGVEDVQTLDNIKKGALLHDVGKIAIPDSILKKPGSLSASEWDKIKLHPSLGYGLIKEIKLVQEIGNIILYHHEHFDGKGYPNNLKKQEIPLEARIFSVADALDAITSYRPYRKERDFQYAREEIQRKSESQFDPKVVDAFCSMEVKKWEKIRYESTKLMPFFEHMATVTSKKSHPIQ
ncbi:MAG: HD domain-containing protein [Candidatus Aminicenantes bacterium]|nr:HD domain-containing protein [Candidatus Aminicenantes bacterium]